MQSEKLKVHVKNEAREPNENCCCCNCSSLTAKWSGRQEEDFSLPYNSGDACHPTAIKHFQNHVNSMESAK